MYLEPFWNTSNPFFVLILNETYCVDHRGRIDFDSSFAGIVPNLIIVRCPSLVNAAALPRSVSRRARRNS